MTRSVGYRRHLRAVMAARGIFATTELGPLLAERGVVLSREQVYRLVVNTPERLNLTTLAALCDILAVTPADLIEVTVESRRLPKAGVVGGVGPGVGDGARPCYGAALRRGVRARTAAWNDGWCHRPAPAPPGAVTARDWLRCTPVWSAVGRTSSMSGAAANDAPSPAAAPKSSPAQTGWCRLCWLGCATPSPPRRRRARR